jgi:hypothetical protein
MLKIEKKYKWGELLWPLLRGQSRHPSSCGSVNTREGEKRSSNYQEALRPRVGGRLLYSLSGLAHHAPEQQKEDAQIYSSIKGVTIQAYLASW